MFEAIKLGFVSKMPILYGIKGCFFFCDKECYKKWSEKHISKEAKEKGDKVSCELKKNLPNAIEGAVKAAQRFVEALNKIKKG